MGKLIRLLLLLVVLAGLTGAGVLGFALYTFHKPGPHTENGEPHLVLIQRGDTPQEIAVQLEKAKAIEDAFQFRLTRRVLGLLPGSNEARRTLMAGEYEIPSGASMKAIVKQLSSGKSLQYAVIIPEGLTSEMIMDLLAKKDWKAAGESDAAYRLEGEVPPTPAEGVMLPGDYMVQRGDTIESVVSRAIKAQQDLLDELWASRQPGLPLKTPEDAVILASIVENETGIAQERPLVASLFINRLRKPMRLQSDPTVVYGISRGAPLGYGLRRSEIAAHTEWNTYQIDGLPKTPICNPGREAIKAVLNPPQTPYYYFVADGTGGHVFAETLDEHNRNVARWREIEKQRNRGQASARPSR